MSGIVAATAQTAVCRPERRDRVALAAANAGTRKMANGASASASPSRKMTVAAIDAATAPVTRSVGTGTGSRGRRATAGSTIAPATTVKVTANTTNPGTAAPAAATAAVTTTSTGRPTDAGSDRVALGQIAAGETVLIHAAAGGTGQAAVRMARHYGATVIAAASPAKHETVRALGADHVLDSRGADLAAEVLRLTGGQGADLVLESAGGAGLAAGLASAKPVTGRVVVYGLAGGDAAITSEDLVYRHQVHVIGLNIGVLIQAAPQIFGRLMGELFGLIAAGVLAPGRPTVYDLADGPKALTELETRATVGKLALVP